MSREQKEVSPESKAGEPVKTNPCKYCRDEIPSSALICKSCLEPQDFWGRSVRFISTALASLVALASLGIGYLQYNDAKNANEFARQAKEGEAAQVQASQEAITQLYNKLDACATFARNCNC